MRRDDLESLPPLETPGGYRLVERLEAKHAASLARVLSESFEDPGWTEERTLAGLLEDPNVIQTVGVLSGDEVVATASCQLLPRVFPNQGVIHMVGALPAHKGRGLGRVAVLAAMRRFRRMGYESLALTTDDDRIPAIRTYFTLGWESWLRVEDPADEARWERVREAVAAFAPR